MNSEQNRILSETRNDEDVRHNQTLIAQDEEGEFEPDFNDNIPQPTTTSVVLSPKSVVLPAASKPRPYDSNRFSDQQISAGIEIIQSFANGTSRWVLLFAQMQSGKTDTFLLVACEMLRQNMIQNISIFSGKNRGRLQN